MAHSALTLDTWLTNTMTRPGCVSRNLYSVTSFWPCAHSALYLNEAVTQPCTPREAKRAPTVRCEGKTNVLGQALHHDVLAGEVEHERGGGQLQRRDQSEHRNENENQPKHRLRRGSHLSKLELFDSSSVMAMPSPLANVPFAPLLNRRV
jgi:hypothetical protein